MKKNSRPGRFRSTATAVATASALAICLAPNALAQDNENEITFSVSNITDFHGHLEQTSDDAGVVDAGAAAVTAQVDALRAEAAAAGSTHIHTTSGDNVGGSAFTSALLNDEPTLDALNAMGVDYSAVGNHEFDQGVEDLQDRIIPGSEYPILGANVVDADGAPILEEYKIQEITNDKGESIDVAFIGTVTEQTANKVSPAAVEGITFQDPEEVTNRIAAELSDGNDANGEADVVIALFHEDGATSNFSDDVDAAFAGDSHLQYQSPAGSTPVVVQALEYGQLMANLDFTVDAATGDVVSIEPKFFSAAEMAALEPNTEVAGIVAGAKAQADIEGAKVVADLDYGFTRGDRNGESGSNRGIESTLNNLIAEAQRSQMSEFTGQDIDLGLMNAGGVRADLAAGEVTYAEAFAVQPFGNDVGYGTLTGADILEALEQQWQDPEGGRPRLALGVSDNFSYSYDPTAAQGQRIIQATINGTPIDPAAEYTVAASTFLFEGGDGFTALANTPKFNNVGVMDVQMFIDYLSETENVQPRWTQSAIGISVEGELTPGSEVTINLESLAYSQNPTATEVTVQIGDAVATAPIDTEVVDEGYGSTGKAQVSMTIPDDFTGDFSDIIVTTDAGVPESPVERPAEGSSEGGFLAAALAAVAAIAGALGLANVFSGGQFFTDIQANIQREINRFLG
ncbi:bifunctional metallophosphatase/5'-nucleotidase [Corynebacterium sp. A21]|uniref:bifunctional metallophosphatase/5'-nucleotidase n=1 Tax=Corynebacterium sp. A21 TaxID=3457318 RepID=UPI003FD448DF